MVMISSSSKMVMISNSSSSTLNIIKPQPHNNINNRRCSSNLLLTSSSNKKLTLVHNRCMKNQNRDIYNVFADKNDDELDDGFTVRFDYIDMFIYGVERAKTLGLDRDQATLDYNIPVKVSTCGVGSKFKLALGIANGMDMEETIAKDLLAMNLNHILVLGAQPTLFLTPRACPRELREAMKDLCVSPISFSDIEKMQSRQITSSIGYGSIEGSFLVTREDIKAGDVLIGLPSNGLHSHGFSLVKRVIEQSGSLLKDNLPGTDITIGESLMTPTTLYVKEVLDIIRKGKGCVKAISYIASGGLAKYVSGRFQHGQGAVIFNDSWPVPPIFKWIQEVGRLEDVEMRQTFNMGIGLVLVINKENASQILAESCCQHFYHIGEVVNGEGVTYQERMA